MSNIAATNPSSYRDPSGFIFEKGGVLYRQVNQVFREDFDRFINSGCYENLVKKGLLISHQRINENLSTQKEWYITLQPEKINFITYPYEWSFDMLKDAALLTLQLVKESMPFGLMLKDATPYNIQWKDGRLIFIDTLSFEIYDETKPWIAYRQFCENFLGPLLLMHYNKTPLQQLQLSYPEGIPLQVIKSMLPFKSRFSLYTYLHIFLHAGIASKKAPAKEQTSRFSKQKLSNLAASLESLILKLQLPANAGIWSGYYEEASQRSDYLDEKKKIVNSWLGQLPAGTTCADLGANEGSFSKLAVAMGISTIAADFDPFCINELYREIKSSGEKSIQPMILDLSNPSPAIGVNNKERNSFLQRVDCGLAMALALIHHLAIGKNIPLGMIADFFSPVAPVLIIEFIPKEDEKVKGMLENKKDIYHEYNEANFETAFNSYYTIVNKKVIASSGRTLYFMKRNG